VQWWRNAKYGESIYNTRGGIRDPRWDGTTISDKGIYVHVMKVPAERGIHLPRVSQKVSSARYLRDNKKVTFLQSESGISLTGIADKQDEPDLIISCRFEFLGSSDTITWTQDEDGLKITLLENVAAPYAVAFKIFGAT
jgi:hypothetical protein